MRSESRPENRESHEITSKLPSNKSIWQNHVNFKPRKLNTLYKLKI